MSAAAAAAGAPWEAGLAMVVIATAVVFFVRAHKSLVRHMALQKALERCAKAWARGGTPEDGDDEVYNIAGTLYGPGLTPVQRLGRHGNPAGDLSAFAPEASRLTIRSRAHTGGGHVRVPWRVAGDRCELSHVLLYVCLCQTPPAPAQAPPQQTSSQHYYVVAAALG